MASPGDEPDLRDAGFGINGLPQTDRGTRADHDALMNEQHASKADDGTADLAAGLAEMGLSPTAAWYSSAVL